MNEMNMCVINIFFKIKNDPHSVRDFGRLVGWLMCAFYFMMFA